MKLRVFIFMVVTVMTVAGVFAFPEIRQDPAYHLFADNRDAFGIPNFSDVISNLPFLVGGIWGLALLTCRGRATVFEDHHEKVSFIFFFLGITMVSFGSAWYHLHPGTETLVWDRLPMSIAFMSIFAGTIGDRMGSRAGILCLGPMIAFGIWSVLHWYYGGDLRPYAIVQFFTLAAIPFLMLLFPARYTHSSWLIPAGVIYGIAKIFEELDKQIFDMAKISGHTFKHLAASAAAFFILAMMRQRKVRAVRG